MKGELLQGGFQHTEKQMFSWALLDSPLLTTISPRPTHGKGRKRCTGDGRLLLVELQMEVDDRLDAVPEHVEGHVLVGRMDAVRLKTEAHEDGLHTENLLECGDDGDASVSYTHLTLPTICSV